MIKLPDLKFEELGIKDALYMANHLAEFFKDEPYKIALWIVVPNPMFGNISPASLIAIGRGHKVIEFIKQAREESQLP